MLKRFTFLVLSISLLFSSLSCCCPLSFLDGGTPNGGVPKEVTENDFSLTLLDGKTVNLNDLKGKPVVVNFFATWCGPCREEAPTLESAYQKYKYQVEFIGIATSSEEGDVRSFVEERGLSFSVGIDSSGEISKKYNVSAIPATFFINREGEVADSFVGAISSDELSQKIGAILK